MSAEPLTDEEIARLRATAKSRFDAARLLATIDADRKRLRAELRQRDDRIEELCRIIERAGQPFIDEANRQTT